MATSQLEGGLSRAIERLSASLADLRLRLEASIDFPDEDYHFIDRAGAARTLRALHAPVLALSREWSPRLDRSFELLGFEVRVEEILGGFFGTVRDQDPMNKSVPEGSVVTLKVV